MILTHIDVDLDAASSACLYYLLTFGKWIIDVIEFVPADYNEPLEQADIAIDIECGGKGIKGEKSAFSAILEIYGSPSYKSAFKDLADLLDVYDSTGTFPQLAGFPGMTIIDVFRYIKNNCVSDLYIVEVWFKIISGIYTSFVLHETAKTAANKAEIVEDIPIIKNAPSGTSNILLARGYEFVIYEDEFNLGVIRSNTSTKDLRKALSPIFPDWFHHKSGFLSCWGGRKAPKSSPSNISAEKLAEIVSTIK